MSGLMYELQHLVVEENNTLTLDVALNVDVDTFNVNCIQDALLFTEFIRFLLFNICTSALC